MGNTPGTRTTWSIQVIPTSEKLVPIRDIRETLPGRPSYDTITRWFTKGKRGVRLDCARVGRSLCTSLEAMRRFVVLVAQAERKARRA